MRAAMPSMETWPVDVPSWPPPDKLAKKRHKHGMTLEANFMPPHGGGESSAWRVHIVRPSSWSALDRSSNDTTLFYRVKLYKLPQGHVCRTRWKISVGGPRRGRRWIGAQGQNSMSLRHVVARHMHNTRRLFSKRPAPSAAGPWRLASERHGERGPECTLGSPSGREGEKGGGG